MMDRLDGSTMSVEEIGLSQLLNLNMSLAAIADALEAGVEEREAARVEQDQRFMEMGFAELKRAIAVDVPV